MLEEKTPIREKRRNRDLTFERSKRRNRGKKKIPGGKSYGKGPSLNGKKVDKEKSVPEPATP